jgi:hypothetical protein
MRFFAIAALIFAFVLTAGATERDAMSINPDAYDPPGGTHHGPQTGEGFVIKAQRAATVYYNFAEFMAVLEPGYFYDDFSWCSWGTVSGTTTYQFGPVNGYSYTASAASGLFSIPGAMSTNGNEDPITLTFDGDPVTAVAGDFFATDYDGFPQVTVVTVVLDDGTTVDLTYPTTFVGFTAVVPIVSITISCGDSTWATYDNFYVGQMTSVPVEHQSWGLIKALYR